jgi:uncharacterized Zn-binding protein involved in type VI secretion
MGRPAARLTDMHVCPLVNPGPVPHVGGPILPACSANILIGNLPAARLTDKASCVGPVDVIVQGSPTVLFNNLLAARMGDRTAHGGVIVMGMPNVLIGDRGGGPGFKMTKPCLKQAAAAGSAFVKAGSAGSTGATGGGKAAPLVGGLVSRAAKRLVKWVGGVMTKAGFVLPPPQQWKTNVKASAKVDFDLLSAKQTIFNRSSKTSKTPQDLKKSVKYEVGVSREKSVGWKQLGGEKANIRLGTAGASGMLGVKGDLSGDFKAGVFGSANATAVSASAKGQALKGLLVGNASVDVLSAKGSAFAGFVKKGKDIRAGGELKASAMLVEGTAKGEVRISPKTIYDNTIGRAIKAYNPAIKHGALSAAWDHGVSLSAKVDAGIGAAAEASAKVSRVGGIRKIDFGGKVGLGPSLGFNLGIGVF